MPSLSFEKFWTFPSNTNVIWLYILIKKIVKKYKPCSSTILISSLRVWRDNKFRNWNQGSGVFELRNCWTETSNSLSSHFYQLIEKWFCGIETKTVGTRRYEEVSCQATKSNPSFSVLTTMYTALSTCETLYPTVVLDACKGVVSFKEFLLKSLAALFSFYCEVF